MALSRLKEDPTNPRAITSERLDDLKAALQSDRDMLACRPVLATPDGTVIAGNMRLVAARQLGWKAIPVMAST